VNIQHTETLPLVLVEVLVVHLVGPPDGTDIGIVAAGKPFESLVDDHIMDNKVGKAVGHDAKADGMQPPKTRGLHTIHDAHHVWESQKSQKRHHFSQKSQALPDDGLCGGTKESHALPNGGYTR